MSQLACLKVQFFSVSIQCQAVAVQVSWCVYVTHDIGRCPLLQFVDKVDCVGKNKGV